MQSRQTSRTPVVVDQPTRVLLDSLLMIDPIRAEFVRNSTPSRRRPLRQQGPTATYGPTSDRQHRRDGPD